MKRLVPSVAAVAGCAALLAAAGAQAQKYPDRPIRLIVPFATGGTSDLLARVLGARLGEVLGATVVVDNRGGGGGTIGVALTAQAVPDGYTLLLAHVGMAVNETLYPRRPYDAVRDLAPISMLGETPNALVVAANLPAKTLPELIALARKEPGVRTASSAGVGSAAHLALALFEAHANVRFNHIPFKGGGPSLTAVAAGEVDMSIPAYPTATPHVKTGRLRLLAVTGTKREPTAPDVPTVAEAGVPGYAFGIWFSMFAPAATPRPIIDRLHREIVRALAAPDMRERLHQLGVNAESSSPAELGRHLQAEVAKWAKIVRSAAIPLNP